MAENPEARWSRSDKLAIALTCLAAIMALILFWIDKTPRVAGGTVAVMIGLVVYPVIHFVPSRKARLPVLLVVLALIALFGRKVWPKKANPVITAQVTPTPQPAPVPVPIPAKPATPIVQIQQKGKVNTANPGTITGSIKQDGSCNVIQNGGSGNTASPTCNPDPMAITRQYFCTGEALVKDPRGTAFGTFHQEPGYQNDFNSMAALIRAGDQRGVLSLCTKEREEHPEWPTPVLICAVANSNLGDTQAVIHDLKEFDVKKVTLVDADPSRCDQIESQLKQLYSIP